MSSDGGKWINNADLQMKVKNYEKMRRQRSTPSRDIPIGDIPQNGPFFHYLIHHILRYSKATLAELIAIRSAMNPSNLPLVSIYATCVIACTSYLAWELFFVVRIGSYSLVSATKTLEFCTWCIETWTSDVTWRDYILKCWYVFPTSLVTSLCLPAAWWNRKFQDIPSHDLE